MNRPPQYRRIRGEGIELDPVAANYAWFEEREQRFCQILDALFQIAEPGPVKNSLWQAYQKLVYTNPVNEDIPLPFAEPGIDRVPETDAEAEQALQQCISHELGKKTAIELYRLYREMGSDLLDAYGNVLMDLTKTV